MPKMPNIPSSKLERRTMAQEFRVSSDAAPVIEGYACKFNVFSEDFGGWRETIAASAFDACLATSPDVRGLFNHDPNLVLGRTAAGTLKIKTDETGIFYSIDPPNTQVARDLMVSMKRGDINQSSFAMICDEAAWEWDEKTDTATRTIMKAQLFDVSPVTYPAYPDATSGVRSLRSLRSLLPEMPKEVRSHMATRAAATDMCSCDCAECVAGNCADCTAEDCNADGCTCDPNRSKTPGAPTLLTADEVGDLRMRLRIAEVRARL
jgi:HK97 family phage prohead protease